MLEIDITLPRLRFKADVKSAGVSAVFGPSGAGKSTLLRVIAGLERGASGTVRFNRQCWQDAGSFLPPERRRIGYVFQDARLFDHLTVLGNLKFAAYRAKDTLPQNLPQTPMAALAAMGVADLAHRRPHALSGGEAARVALARAVISAPQILLMDEPLAALDHPRREAILPLIEAIAATIPVIYVSHALDEVTRLARDIYVLDRGELRAQGPLSTVLTDPAAAPFLGPRGAGAVLSAQITAHHRDGVSELEISGGVLIVPSLSGTVGRRVTLRIPAADVIVAKVRPEGISALNILPASILRVDPVEGGVLVMMRCGTDVISARLTQRSNAALNLRTGEQVFAIVKSLAIGAA
jgi:molybdate transport system ATP-binding protein